MKSMTKADANSKVREYFQEFGFPCPQDKAVAKIEGFPGKLDLQIHERSGTFCIESHVYRPCIWEALNRCFEKSLSGLERKDDPKGKKQERCGVGFCFDTGISSDCTRTEYEKLLSHYLAYRAALTRVIKDDESVSDRFHVWLFSRRGLDGLDISQLDDFLSEPIFSTEHGGVVRGVNAYDVADEAEDGKIVAIPSKMPKEYQDVADVYVEIFNEFCDEVVKGDHPLKAEEVEKGRAMANCHSSTSRIMRMLRHTERKNYENYVVTGIWHRLQADDRLHKRGDTSVRFETQKAVQIVVDGVERQAYIDMYFPALNVAVECDEVFHKKQSDADRKRQTAIMRKLKIDPEDFLRVDASVSFAEMDRQIAHIVDRICEKALGNLKSVQDDWYCSVPSTAIRGTGRISDSDDYVFSNEGDALCAVGVPRGRQIKGRGRLHSTVMDGKIVQVGFVELPDDGKNDWGMLDSALMQQLKGVSQKVPLWLFAKYADASGSVSYRFKGEYAYDGNERHYVRVARQLSLKN